MDTVKNAKHDITLIFPVAMHSFPQSLSIRKAAQFSIL